MARILVIEDNEANLKVFAYLIKSRGHTVSEAVTGPDGWNAILRDKPDLVVCDIQLPGFDGVEILHRVRSTDLVKHTPMVAVTAFALLGDRERYLAEGFNHYLSKPIDPRRFVDELEQLLRPAPAD